MHRHPSYYAVDSLSRRVRSLQPPLADGTFLVPLTDQVDTVHDEHPPEAATNRYREAVILDRLFWTTIALLMTVGVGLRIWILF